MLVADEVGGRVGLPLALPSTAVVPGAVAGVVVAFVGLGQRLVEEPAGEEVEAAGAGVGGGDGGDLLVQLLVPLLQLAHPQRVAGQPVNGQRRPPRAAHVLVALNPLHHTPAPP